MKFLKIGQKDHYISKPYEIPRRMSPYFSDCSILGPLKTIGCEVIQRGHFFGPKFSTQIYFRELGLGTVYLPV